MVFHCLGIPYAPTRKEVSLCAFVQKVYKFCEEMTKRGHTIYHYGHENSNVKCTEHIHVFNNDTLKRCYGDINAWKQHGFNQDVGNEAFSIFNVNCIAEIEKRLHSNKDFILCWFGYGHQHCAEHFKDRAIIVEPSIGYDSMFAPIKIFETYSQMHKMHAIHQTPFELNKEFVTYPGFDSSDFQYEEKKEDYALFLGRIIEAKGAQLAYNICNTIHHPIIFAGPNILGLQETQYCKFVGFVGPEERKKLLSKAKFLFAPSLFAEPCNWTVIEAQFSGTPSITTDFGGFTETVVQGETGIRCPTVPIIMGAIDKIDKLCTPQQCFSNALLKYTVEHQCNNYEFIFRTLLS